MSPAASSQEVPANSPGRGWVRVTCHCDSAACSFSACSSGANRAAASATSLWMVGIPNPLTRAASSSSTHRAASNGSERVASATWRVL